MPDGLQSFNIPPPNPQLTQQLARFTAPPDYMGGAPLTPLTGVTLPDRSTSTTAPNAVAPTAPTQQPTSAPIPFPLVLQRTEQNLGKRLSEAEFDKLASDYRTNYAAPTLASEYKGKKALIEPQMAAFDNGVQHLRDQRYAAQESSADSKSGIGDFLKSLGASTAASTGRNILSQPIMAAAAVASGFGLAPNAVSDAIFKYGIDPNTKPSGKTDAQAGVDFAKRFMGQNYNDPKFASLRTKMEALGAQNNPKATGLGGIEDQLDQFAQKTSPTGAAVGNVAGMLASLALTKRAIGAPTGLSEVPKDANRVLRAIYGLRESGPLAANLGLGFSNESARRNVENGQDIANVLKQYGVDVPIDVASTLLPISKAGGALVRGSTGALIGVGTAGARGVADANVNPQNPAFDPATLVGKEGGTQAALGAGLALLFGSRGGNALRRVQSAAKPDAAEPAPAAPAPATPVGDTSASVGDPIELYTTTVNNGAGEGLEQPTFIKTQAAALKKANDSYKVLKPSLAGMSTPEAVVNGAVRIAQRFTGKAQWGKLNVDQRQQTVETMAAWLGKKTKVDTDEISARLRALRNPAESTTPVLNETPLPSDITGEQVPGTTPQEVVASPAPASVVRPEVNDLWQSLTDPAKANPAQLNNPLIAKLDSAIKAGSITSPEHLQTLLDDATTKAATKPKLALKSAPKPAAVEPPKTDVPKNTLKAKPKAKSKVEPKQETETQRNKRYFSALMNREKAPSSPEEATLRNDPAFNSAAEAMRAGKITSAEDVGRFLKGQNGTNTVGDALSGHENKLVGALLGTRGNKAEVVQARKAVRETLVDPLLKLGEDKNAINKMTVAEATAHLQKLANTFSGSETALPKANKLKASKSKTDIAPVEKPADEPIPPKPKGKLAKPKAAPKEAGKSKTPKSAAPESESGAATPLEGQIKTRFGRKLPDKQLDQLHDAIAEAQTGDRNNLDDFIAVNSGEGIDQLTRNDIKWIKSKAKEEVNFDVPNETLHENNASGESKASLEAINRRAQEKDAGQTRAIIRRDGSVEPQTTADSVDIHARSGEVVVQRGVGKNKWTILSHGDDITPDVARGKVNRAETSLDSLHENGAEDTGPVKVGEYSLNLDTLEELHLDRQKTAKNTSREPSKIQPVQVTRRVNKILSGIREGSDVVETGRSLQKLADDIAAKRMEQRLTSAMRERRRGVEWIRARLQRMIADSDPDSDHARAGKFGLWLLDKAPHLADDLGISIREKMPGDASGYFIPLSRVIGINAVSTNPGTVVHEVLHSAERLMPKLLQDKIRGEYIGRLQNKMKQADKNNNNWAKLYLEHAARNFVNPSKYSQDVMSSILRKHSGDVPANEYYKYFNSSEYFAVEGTSILARRHGAGSWITKAKEFINEYVQHVRSFLGLESNSKVYKALSEVLVDRGTAPKSEQLSRSKDTAKDISDEQQGEAPTDEQVGYETAPDADADPTLEKEPPKKAVKIDLGAVNNSQRFIENYMGADYGLEKHMQAVRRVGLKVTEQNDVETAAYDKNGMASRYNKIDRNEALDPTVTWLYANVDKFAKNMPEFLHNLNKFFGNTNWLERGYTSWYDESPFDIDGALDRAEIKDQLIKREISGAEARKQMVTLAKKHAQFTPEEWMRHEQMPVDTIQAELDKLKTNLGMDQSSMQELNGLVDLARARARARLIEAGRFAEDDPYKDYYGWKWYVPLKGSAYNGRDDGNFDLVPTKNIGLRILNSQIKTMEGRKGFAEQPFVRMFVDMARAGSDAAASKVRTAAYHNQLDVLEKFNGELEAASGDAAKAEVRRKYEGLVGEIHTFDGGPKDGYTNTQTGDHVDRLKAPLNGVIVNDGDTHYVLTFPKNSQLRRGLTLMDAVEQPSDNLFPRIVAKSTNVLARLYTTIDPGWQTFKGFVRDLTYVPITVGAKMHDNPLAATPLWTAYAGNVIQAYRAAPTFWAHLKGDVGALRRMAADNPGSWAALTDRYEAAGGGNDFTKGFDIPGMERIMQARFKDINGVLDATKWGGNKILEYTGNYANFLESVGRVAMFKTLTEMGHTDRAAALEVRKALDYSKSGIKGRRINSWLAFFRVGMTGADAMRRAFTKPTGGFDYVKAAKWQSFMAALGYIGTLGMSAVIGKDDDGVDKLAKVAPGLLTQKLMFPMPDGRIAGMDLGLGLPQVLLAPGILSAAASLGYISNEKAAKTYLDTLARNGPITPAGMKSNTTAGLFTSYVLGFTPTVVRPLVDVDRNVNVFDSPIHRDEDTNKYASDSGRPNTPQEFKEMAQWLRQASGGLMDYHPEDIRYLIQSYGGQLGTGLVKFATSNPDVAAGAPPTPSRMASRVFVDTSHYMQNQLYDTLDKLRDSRRRYNSIVARAKDDGASDAQAKAQADKIISRDSQFKEEMQAYRTLDGARKAYAKKVTELRNNKLLSDTRKQLMRKRLDSQLREVIEKAQKVSVQEDE